LSKGSKKVKKILISAVLALMLVAVIAVPAMADAPGEVGKTATVTVTAYKSVTVTDNGATGLSFGSLNPGTEKQAEAASPSLTISAAAENNGTVAVSIKGTDFSGTGHTLTIDNAFWKTTNDSVTATAMTISYASVTTLAAGAHVDIYHWLSIPAAQAADSYTSTFTYKTE
jgi:hypothetical protein